MLFGLFFLLVVRTVPTVWYLVCFSYWLLELFWQYDILFVFPIGCWNCSDSMIFGLFFLLVVRTVLTVWYFVCFSFRPKRIRFQFNGKSDYIVKKNIDTRILNFEPFLLRYPPFYYEQNQPTQNIILFRKYTCQIYVIMDKFRKTVISSLQIHI